MYRFARGTYGLQVDETNAEYAGVRMAVRRWSQGLAAALVLSACGGGGGFSGVRSSAPPPSYSVITSNAAVPAQSFPTRLDQPGTLRTRNAVTVGSATWTAAGVPQSVRLDITIRNALVSGSDIFFTETFTAFSPIVDPATGVSFSASEKTAGDGSIRRVRLMTPASLGLHYSTLGAWEYAPSASALQTFAAQFAMGPATRGTELPTSGSAHYGGVMIGKYADGTAIVPVSAYASASANFGARVLHVGTSGTYLEGPNVGRPDLDIDMATSALGWSVGSNVLSGTLRTGGGAMSGSASGRFYGPAAAELGGSFFLRSGSDTEQMSGAFVMKKSS